MKISITDFSSIFADEALQGAVWGVQYAEAIRNPLDSNMRSFKKLTRTTLAMNEEDILRVIQSIGAGDTHRSSRKEWLWEIQYQVSENDDESDDEPVVRSEEQIARIRAACDEALQSIYVRKNGLSKGMAKAHISMARDYLDGYDFEKNEDLGMELLQPLVDQGNPKAQQVLGEFLLKSGRDRARGLDLLERASARGDVSATGLLAAEYMGQPVVDAEQRVLGFDGTRVAEGIPLLIRAAAGGDTVSIERLGHMSLSGAYVPQDVREGVRLLSSLPEYLRDLYGVDDLHLSRFEAQD